MIHWKGKSKPKLELEPRNFSVSNVYTPLFKEVGEKTHESLEIRPISSNKPNLNKSSASIQDAFAQDNLILEGDNLHVLHFLKENLNTTVDLIYIDPPFMKNVSFFRQINLRGIDEEVIYKQKQYSDTWDLDKYLQFLYERLWLLKSILSETGSIYVHLDEDAAHYGKVILDEVFGKENFRRQIIWNTASLNVAGFKGQVRDNYIYATGILLFYSKTDTYSFNPQFTPHSQEFVDKKYKNSDENGRYRITRRDNKIYLKEDPGEPVTNIWNDILSFNYAKIASRESVFYPTQKPEALLERILKTSSNPGDVVLDCFSGSGTTAAVAQKLDRKWIVCDSNKNAIHTCSKRLQRLINPNISSNETLRSFQVWDGEGRKHMQNPLTLESRCKDDTLLINILAVDENLVYSNANVKQKKSPLPKFALLDSVLISFTDKSIMTQPYRIQYSDIPRGRKEPIKGNYIIFIPKWIKKEGFVHIRVFDIFGNRYDNVLDFSEITDNNSD